MGGYEGYCKGLSGGCRCTTCRGILDGTLPPPVSPDAPPPRQYALPGPFLDVVSKAHEARTAETDLRNAKRLIWEEYWKSPPGTPDSPPPPARASMFDGVDAAPPLGQVPPHFESIKDKDRQAKCREVWANISDMRYNPVSACSRIVDLIKVRCDQARIFAIGETSTEALCNALKGRLSDGGIISGRRMCEHEPYLYSWGAEGSADRSITELTNFLNLP